MLRAKISVAFVQVKRNVQRTLAGELQKLSVAFRKQQKQHLNRLRQRDGGAGGSFLQDDGRAGGAGAEDDYDPGFTDVQVRAAAPSWAMRSDRVGGWTNTGLASGASPRLYMDPTMEHETCGALRLYEPWWWRFFSCSSSVVYLQAPIWKALGLAPVCRCDC
jgi:hypothetical protein